MTALSNCSKGHGTDQTCVQSQNAVLPMFVTKVPRLMLATDAACERFRTSFFQTVSKALDVPRLQSRIRKSPMAVGAIQSTSYSSMGSWRARVRLPVGRYLLKGEVIILYSSQFANAARPTVLFQDYTGRRDLKSFPGKLNTWVELSSKVDVSDPGQVIELVIGLNGLRSGLLFDLGSLALESCQTP